MLARSLIDMAHLVCCIRQAIQTGGSGGPCLADKQAQVIKFPQLLYERRKDVLMAVSRKGERSGRVEFAKAVVHCVSVLELLYNDQSL